MWKYSIAGIDYTQDELTAIANDKHDSNIATMIEFALSFGFQEWCKVGDVALDCGASMGWHTYGLARAVGGSAGHVHAFEALPDRCVELREKGRSNGMADHVTIHQVALSKSFGQTTFQIIGDNTGSSTIKFNPGDYREQFPRQEIVVPMETIDRCIPDAQKPRVSFIKMDLEGGDFDAMQGAIETIKQGRPLIISEFGGSVAGNAYDFSEEDFFSFWSRLDFSIFNMFGDGYSLEEYRDWTAFPEIMICPREKLDRGIVPKVGDFLKGKFL